MTDSEIEKLAAKLEAEPQSSVLKTVRKDIPKDKARAAEALAVLAETHPVTKYDQNGKAVKVRKPKKPHIEALPAGIPRKEIRKMLAQDTGGDKTPAAPLARSASGEMPDIPKILRRKRTAESDAAVERINKTERDRREGKSLKSPPNGSAKPKAKAKAGSNSGSKKDLIASMLRRKEGCTTAEVLAATGWAAVSMPQQAKAADLKLVKDKKPGEPTRYRAA